MPQRRDRQVHMVFTREELAMLDALVRRAGDKATRTSVLVGFVRGAHESAAYIDRPDADVGVMVGGVFVRTTRELARASRARIEELEVGRGARARTARSERAHRSPRVQAKRKASS
jgi:hypothetical protein